MDFIGLIRFHNMANSIQTSVYDVHSMQKFDCTEQCESQHWQMRLAFMHRDYTDKIGKRKVHAFQEEDDR